MNDRPTTRVEFIDYTAGTARYVIADLSADGSWTVSEKEFGGIKWFEVSMTPDLMAAIQKELEKSRNSSK